MRSLIFIFFVLFGQGAFCEEGVQEVSVLRFSDSSIVRISLKKEGIEFFGLRDCPNEAADLFVNTMSLDLEKCKMMGSPFYRVFDLRALQVQLSKQLEDLEKRTHQYEIISSIGVGLGVGIVGNSLLIYAAQSASSWPLLRQVNRFYNWYFSTFILPETVTIKKMRFVKGVWSAVAVPAGVLLAYKSYSDLQRIYVQDKERLSQLGIKLKTSKEYIPEGIGAILDFTESKSGNSEQMKTLLYETIENLQSHYLIRGYDLK